MVKVERMLVRIAKERRNGKVRDLMKAHECTWGVDVGFLCVVHVSLLYIVKKTCSVVFVYVSLFYVAMTTCLVFPCFMCKQILIVLLYLEKVSMTWIQLVFQLPCLHLDASI